jgi:hypothetical protein
MNNCKACNKEFEPLGFEKFCSEECATDFSKVMSKIQTQNAKAKKEPEPELLFSWQIILKKRGKYTIPNKELEDIYDSTRERTKFEMLLS